MNSINIAVSGQAAKGNEFTDHSELKEAVLLNDLMVQSGEMPTRTSINCGDTDFDFFH